MVNDDGDIIVTGELITNSHAKGCFIVLQGNSTQADIFMFWQEIRRVLQG